MLSIIWDNYLRQLKKYMCVLKVVLKDIHETIYHNKPKFKWFF